MFSRDFLSSISDSRNFPDKLLGYKGREDRQEELLLPLVLLLGPEPRLQRPPGLEEGLPLGPLGKVLCVGAAPVDGSVEYREGGEGVIRV